MNNMTKRTELSKVIWNCSTFLQETQEQKRMLTTAKNYCNKEVSEVEKKLKDIEKVNGMFDTEI